jgi:hypothetical protein
MHVTHEDRQSIWLLTFGPAIWAAHFLMTYVTAAVWCAKYTTDGTTGPLHELVTAFTVIALIGIGVIGYAGWRRHTYGEGASAPHDDDTPEDRHRFLGLATFMLAALSAVATAYVGGSAFFFETCR